MGEVGLRAEGTDFTANHGVGSQLFAIVTLGTRVLLMVSFKRS